MLKIIHAADFHLDSPFAALSEEQAALRRREQRQLLASLAEAAEGADIVLLPGDLLDSGVCHAETVEALEGFLNALPGRVFIAPGNHDYYAPESPWDRMELRENIHIFTSPQPEPFQLPELGCTVWGAAFTGPRSAGKLRSFRAPAEGVQLMLLHGDVGGGMGYDPIGESEIAASGLKYLALGHVHTCSGLRQSGDTYWAYPGCLMGRGFDETGDKGVYLGTLDRGEVTLDFIPLAWRRYLRARIDITGRDPELALQELMDRARAQDILRIVLTGERDENNEPDLTALTALAAGYFYSADLEDRTVLAQSLWARMEEDTLTGLFLRTMRRRLDGAEAREKPVLERAIRFGLAALEGREEPK